MSVEAALVAALSGVAGGRVYPIVAPEKAIKPFVVYKAQAEPIVDLAGNILADVTTVTFEAWGETYASALATSAAVRAAIQASALAAIAVPTPEDGYDPQVDEYVRPVSFQFWQ